MTAVTRRPPDRYARGHPRALNRYSAPDERQRYDGIQIPTQGRVPTNLRPRHDQGSLKLPL